MRLSDCEVQSQTAQRAQHQEHHEQHDAILQRAHYHGVEEARWPVELLVCFPELKGVLQFFYTIFALAAAAVPRNTAQ